MLYMDENGRIRRPDGRFGKMEDYLLQLMYEAYEEEKLASIEPDEDFDPEMLDEFPDYPLGAGAEVEWSVTYRGRGGRTLHIKLRVEVQREMTSHTALRLIERAARDGVAPPAIDLHWIDWASGEHGSARGGHFAGRKAKHALRSFHALLQSPNIETRFSLVRD